MTPSRVIAAVLLAGLLLAAPAAMAQSVTVDLGAGEGLFTGRLFQLVVLITVLSLAPSILVVVTSFTRIVVVLSLLRSALGIQTTPPNIVLISLALFLTMFIMAPTFQQAYDRGVAPLIDQQITEEEAYGEVVAPFRGFMLGQVRDKDLALFKEIDGETPATADEVSLTVLVPAFVISELRRAFEIAFLIFIPFIIIDMVVASVLMSMGMMMLPPVIIALPFKLIFFVLLDGWYLVAGSLVQSFGAN
jgi:flagellar biosynthetic protein FliP